jgi:hypothetical protein
MIWIVYVALEPFVRRRFPQILVSWSRLLAGDWNDPLVARDVLIGCAFGSFRIVLAGASNVAASMLHYPEGAPVVAYTVPFVLTGTNQILAFVTESFYLTAFAGFLFLFLFFLLHTVFKNRILAGFAWVLVIVVLNFFPGRVLTSVTSTQSWAVVAVSILTLILLLRFGFLSLLVSFFAAFWLSNMPLTLQTSAWYFNIGLAAVCLILGIGVWEFRASLGGRPIVGTLTSEE